MPGMDTRNALQSALAAGDSLRARQLLADAGPDGREALWSVLASAASGGSTSGRELLLEQLSASGVVHRFVASRLLDEASVDDVVQETLISVANSVDSFRGGAAVTTWVASIAHRRVVDHLRRRREAVQLPADVASPGARLSSQVATREALDGALRALPPPYREVVVLREVRGLSYAEIADHLERPLGTVKAQVARGRALAAHALREGQVHR